jgi:hypothetical protein
MDQMFPVPQPEQGGPENLPQPIEQGEVAQNTPEVAPKPKEMEASGADKVAQAYYGSQAAPVVIPLAPVQAVGALQDDIKTPTSHLSQSEDIEVIDKAVIDKAKAIVEKTKEDPHKQSQELTQMKKDYIEDRFNKKLPDNQAA